MYSVFKLDEEGYELTLASSVQTEEEAEIIVDDLSEKWPHAYVDYREQLE